MTIAVSTESITGRQPEVHRDLIVECFGRLAQKYPEHKFLFISDKPRKKELVSGSNVLSIVTGPQTKNALLLQYWFNYKLPAVLKKYKADVFVGMDGVCSLRTKIPQCLVLQDLSFLQHPKFFKGHLRFYKRSTAKFLAKAGSIATVSEFSKDLIVSSYKIDPGKIDIIHAAAPGIFKPISFEEKEKVKEQYAEGKEYFLFTGNIDIRSNLINLLKAFSFFKKRQKSNMMLLIAGETDEADEQFSKDLSTFKFRDEVRLLGKFQQEELAKITAASYVFVYPSLYEDFAVAPLQAMQCEVPVVTSKAGALPGLYGEAALYADPGDFKDIAEKMMLVFKDENKARELVNLGRMQAQRYDWDKTAALLWQTILKAANK